MTTAADLEQHFIETVGGLPGGPARPDGAAPVRPGSSLDGDMLLAIFDAQVQSRHLDFAARWMQQQGRGFYTISSAGHEGRPAGRAWGAYLAAVAMVAFAVAETRAAHPMVPLGLFRSRAVSVCVAIGFAVNIAFYGVIFVLSLYFQRVLGQSAVTAGLEFLPMTALLPVANLTSARLGARFGPQTAIKAGLLVSVAGLVALLAAGTRPITPRWSRRRRWWRQSWWRRRQSVEVAATKAAAGARIDEASHE